MALRTLYEGLVRVAPTLGALVSLASTIAETTGAASGLAFLDGIDEPAIGRFQSAWATRAHLLVELGRIPDAVLAYDTAISLTADAPSRQLLEARAAAVRS
jgi:RNA polymerase sigma-70 factor (ECF subfamily)